MAALLPFGSALLAIALTAPSLASSRAAADASSGSSAGSGSRSGSGAGSGLSAGSGEPARRIDWRRDDLRPVAFDLRGPSERRGGWRLMADLSDPFEPAAARPRTLPRTSLRFMFDDLHRPQLDATQHTVARDEVHMPGDLRDPFTLAGFRGGFFSDNPFDHVEGDLWSPFAEGEAATAAEPAPPLDCARAEVDAGLAALWMLVCRGRVSHDTHDALDPLDGEPASGPVFASLESP